MPVISLLPDLVISQIAAGEVLENPASAVKELLENAIDAGAQGIRIDLEGGGLKKLVIEDDGCGMDPVDAATCLQRHATSKLRKLEDLEQLLSLGFRGEALAAIAAVSKLRLTTSNGRQATEVVAEGGAILRTGPCARNRGTTVEVRELFFNTPARLKFQKSAGACAAAILHVVETTALAHPEIRFSLRAHGKETFAVREADWRARVEEILGSFAHVVERPTLRALLGSPQEAKLTRTGQRLFVNRRPVFSPLIAKAVKQGFGTRIEERLFPGFVLFLDVAPESVDVNVHPQKREVRFRDESRLFEMVRAAVASAFEASSAPLAPLPWSFVPPPLDLPTFAPSFIMNDAPRYQAPLPSFIMNDAPWHQAPLPLAAPQERPIALLGDFLLLEGEAWTLLDVRGAEARIAFEALEALSSVQQPLLVPFTWVCDAPEALAEQLRAAHLEARVVGKRTVAIDALPQGVALGELSELVGELSRGRSRAAAITRACRASKRALSFELAAAIWRQLRGCKDTNYDPLGKKIVVAVTPDTLQELFQ